MSSVIRMFINRTLTAKAGMVRGPVRLFVGRNKAHVYDYDYDFDYYYYYYLLLLLFPSVVMFLRKFKN